MVARFLENTQNLVSSRFGFAEESYRCAKLYDERASLCSLTFCFVKSTSDITTQATQQHNDVMT